MLIRTFVVIACVVYIVPTAVVHTLMNGVLPHA